MPELAPDLNSETNPPPLHRHLILSLTGILQDIFWGGFYADKVIERYFKNHPKWGGRDRKFIAEATYEIVRNWRFLWFQMGKEPGAEARTEELHQLFSTWWILKNRELPTWWEFPTLTLPLRETPIPRAIRYSIPDWIDQLGLSEMGEEWESILGSLNQQAEVILRANRLKNSAEELKVKLEGEEVFTDFIQDYPDALKLSERKNVFSTKAFKEGFFEVQDASSQAVAPFAQVKAGQTVVDACAGAGGKTLHLAAIMKNKGRIYALDVDQRKLDELRKRASRAGADGIETRLIDTTKVIKRLKDSADVLLLDVPCSGMGVWRRNPDSKWKFTEADLQSVLQTQKEILAYYSQIVKPGGKLVYSTCSILKRENEDQIRSFLEAHPSFKLEEEKRLWPHKDGFDGFFMARLSKSK